ncbi:MAG: alpha-amylase, partial [Muribaculaceae bacterium]|nr:alpha-amylase [Muribaculaceae bacterium]
QYDWYETVKLNYGHDYNDNSDHFNPVPDTWLKMLHILRFWASKGVDGFRCDMVFMVPLAFWHWAIPQVKSVFPHVIFIGEIYDVGLYRPFLDYGCFDYLYDKVNLYDTLVGIETHGWSAAQLTGCWQTVDGIGDRMLNFLENHDELRFASKAYAGDSLRVIPSLVTSAMISTGPFLIYYGQELGEPARDNEGFAGDNDRTTIFDYWSLSTVRRWMNGGKCDDELLSPHEKWLRDVYRKVLTMCNANPAIREGGFFDLMYANLRQPGFDPHRHFAFVRHKGDEVLLIVVNFSREAANVSIMLPKALFDVVEIEEGEIVTTDLLWDKPHKLSLAPDRLTNVYLSAADAVILPVGKKRGERKEAKNSGKSKK